MLKIKTLLMAAAISTGVALVMPAMSQAMPTSAPVKMGAAQNGNLVEVYYHKKKWHGYSHQGYYDYHHHHHHHHYYGYGYGYGYPYYYPYYGYYEPYPYYGYYGPRYYYPRYYGPGIGFSFRF